MATNFPTGLDALTNPTGSNTLASPNHAAQHSDANDAIEALQAKVGVNGSAVTTSLDYLVANLVPAGSVMQYAGSTAPTGWLLCNTSTPISRSTYAALFAAIGTTYGAGNGTTTFNIPFLSGRVPVGAGTGSGLTLRNPADTGGAETVTLTAAQSGTTAHGHANTISATTGNQSVDHVHNANHGHTGSSTGGTPDHAHIMGRANISQAGTNRLNVSASPSDVGLTTYGVNANHTHAITVDANNFNTGGMSANHNHAVTISGGVTNATAASAASSHENMPPFLAMNYIIKI
jgi:microcystin-dependent protein